MKNNQKGYKWYVVSSRGIDSGWEYKEDARDSQRDEGGKVYSKRTLLAGGLDPDRNASWSKGPPVPRE